MEDELISEEGEMEIPLSVIEKVLGHLPAAQEDEAESEGAATPEDIPELPEFTDLEGTPEETEPAGEEEESETTPPVPPGGPVFADPATPAFTPDTPPAPPESQYSPQQIAAWAELDRVIRSNAGAAEYLHNLITRQAAPPVASQPQPSPLPPLPSREELDLEDPATRLAVVITARQQQEIAQLREQIQRQEQATSTREIQELRGVADSAASDFQARYNIPDEVMADVRTEASKEYPFFASQIRATGDQFKAAVSTFEKAYWLTPSARQFEIERQARHQQSTQARKQKLAGVGGSSGSATREPKMFDESTKEGRHAAAVAFAAAAMNEDQ